jgi:phage replication O-like protein O
LLRRPPVSPETQVDLSTQVQVATEVPTATQVPPQTSVAGATLVSASAQVPVRTQVDPPTPVVPQTTVGTETPVPAATQVPVPTSVPAATQVAESTPVTEPTKVAPQAKVSSSSLAPVEEGPSPSASGQDSSVTLEAQAAPKLHNGYTRLPNSILMRMAAGDLLRSEIQILLLIARFTISYQRRHAPLSKTVLERQSGLRGPAVLQAISELLAKGLIEKIPGDQHRPNQLGLAFTDEWDFFPKPRSAASETTSVQPATQVPAKTQVAVETTVTGKPPVATGNLRPGCSADPGGG